MIGYNKENMEVNQCNYQTVYTSPKKRALDEDYLSITNKLQQKMRFSPTVESPCQNDPSASPSSKFSFSPTSSNNTSKCGSTGFQWDRCVGNNNVASSIVNVNGSKKRSLDISDFEYSSPRSRETSDGSYASTHGDVPSQQLSKQQRMLPSAPSNIYPPVSFPSSLAPISVHRLDVDQSSTPLSNYETNEYAIVPYRPRRPEKDSILDSCVSCGSGAVIINNNTNDVNANFFIRNPFPSVVVDKTSSPTNCLSLVVRSKHANVNTDLYHRSDGIDTDAVMIDEVKVEEVSDADAMETQ